MAKNIEVLLTLDTKGFNRKLKDAKGSLSGFSRQSKVTTGSIIGLASRFAALAAPIVAVGAGFNQLNKALGVAAKFEDVQVTLGNIVGSAEGGAAALNKIRDVARDLPVSFEELAASAPGLATVSGTIGELDENIRLAADIAANFGIPFEVAAGQLQRAFSAGAGAADVFREKGVLAAAGFEAGVSVSVDETIAKLREFGEATKGSAESLNKTFSGAVNQAGDVITDFQAALGDAFKPEVTALLQNLTKAFRDNEEEALAFAKAIGQNVLRGVIAFARGVATAIDLVLSIGAAAKRIGAGLKANFGEQINAIANGVVRAFGFIVESISLVGVGLGKLIELTTGAEDVTNFFENVNDAAANLRRDGLSAIEDTSQALETFIPVTTARDAVDQLVTDFTAGATEIRKQARLTGDAATDLGDDLRINLTNGVVSADEAIKKLTDDLGSVFNIITQTLSGQTLDFGIAFKEAFDFFSDEDRELIKRMDKVKIAIVGIRLAFQDSIISVDEYNTLLRQLTQDKVLEDLGLSAEEAARLIRVLNEEFENQEGIRNFLETVGTATQQLSTDLATAFLEGQSAGAAFQDFFKKLVTQMIADILRLQVIQPILSSVFGLQFGTGGSVTGATGGFFGRMFGYHNGGSLMPNRPAIVGEKGPELFIPAGAGTVVANSHLGQGAPAQNITINAVDTQSFQQALARDPEFIYSLTRVGARRTPA